MALFESAAAGAQSAARSAALAFLLALAGCAPVFECGSYAGLQPVGAQTSICTATAAQAPFAAR